ncbi:hypothetical protein QTL97_05385 [Sporosarcina thermotolerans]|uniref:Uncharacterized protein n=1 Tax=Sporosarcina thermotolerans TaxID=633404 RepID=A0AAW9AB67_9BACL|nr:hypothetical protein [Sporosarcina thermotolerans]MDW0116358.1 hypothetical protein [Sporosarcina thermotolerans]WHT48322.1 hypothetical protein QNH10_00105 [Sporosarcina thermotolerans]
MEQMERKIIRLEMQVGELIRILALLNERMVDIESKQLGKVVSIHKRQPKMRI